MSGVRNNKKLRLMLERLELGDNVQNRDLRTWIGDEAYDEYEAECMLQQELRKELQSKPSAVKEYERRLRLALLAYNKGEGASSRGRHAAAKRYFAEADKLFERALEYLQEIVAAEPSLCAWFDRDTSWTIDGEASIDATSIPRVVTSRSLDNRGGGLLRRLQSKRDLKIAAVERALLFADGEGEKDAAGLTAVQKAQLEAFLKLHDDDL